MVHPQEGEGSEAEELHPGMAAEAQPRGGFIGGLNHWCIGRHGHTDTCSQLLGSLV